MRLSNFFHKMKLLRATNYLTDKSFIIFDNKTEITVRSNVQTIVNGLLKIGGPLPMSYELPSFHKTRIILERNSKLIIEGDVNIASGTYIHVKENATLILRGGNFIGHNNIIICDSQISLGKNSSTSWNVTLIDHDGHKLYLNNGQPLKIPKRHLIIGDNVGIQMNVVIPRGITIGQNSLVGPNSIVRDDIPDDTYIYHLHEMRKKNGISAGLQFSY